MDVAEFQLIDRLAAHLAREGGRVVVAHPDDAAVLRVATGAACVTVDMLVDGVHFRRDLSSLEDVGWKAIAVSCSDLAAMGAAPTGAVIALCVPPGLEAADIDSLYGGMSAAASRWGVALLGGDTVAGPVLSISATLLGEVEAERALRRSGARPGDRLIIVGQLGAAAAALAQIKAGERPDAGLLAAHRRPAALVAAGRALAEEGASACIDVSDGFGADVGHVCRASGVSAIVREESLPVAPGVRDIADRLGIDPLDLICGGEDFALIASASPDRAAAIAESAGRAEGVPAAVVGEIVETDADRPVVALQRTGGGEVELAELGYQHSFGEDR
ncbi:MAG TPA: thiamine-phosphate kinase [Egibacteraceae bacterium]|nr:thiamine-phosphate kinase [Egibacteraceae bacterium]